MSESDLSEQGWSVDGGVGEDPAELGPETPEADAAEQRREVREHGAEDVRAEVGDVDPGDAFEQSRVVDLEEEDYQ